MCTCASVVPTTWQGVTTWSGTPSVSGTTALKGDLKVYAPGTAAAVACNLPITLDRASPGASPCKDYSHVREH